MEEEQRGPQTFLGETLRPAERHHPGDGALHESLRNLNGLAVVFKQVEPQRVGERRGQGQGLGRLLLVGRTGAAGACGTPLLRALRLAEFGVILLANHQSIISTIIFHAH